MYSSSRFDINISPSAHPLGKKQRGGLSILCLHRKMSGYSRKLCRSTIAQGNYAAKSKKSTGAQDRFRKNVPAGADRT